VDETVAIGNRKENAYFIDSLVNRPGIGADHE
jgi:hypothetical protein